MSNGHYTALVESNHIMREALERIARGAGLTSSVTFTHAVNIACGALQRADEISNRNGITQSNEETNNVTK